LNREYTFLGVGRSRAVFLGPNKLFVVKIPINEEGELANCREERLYKKEKNRPDSHWARCRLYPGTMILIMEYVESIHDIPGEKKLPKWVFNIDCAQVGFNKKGKLVAYDFG
jgi:hypothetical protein